MLYNYNDVLEKTKQYFDGDELAAIAWINKYALKDSDKNIYELTPDDMHNRLADEISRVENTYDNPITRQQIYELLKDFQYVIPQGGPMAGIGNNYQITSLSNCFVVGSDPPADSYGGILKTDEQQVQLMKRRGGVGHDLSHLRPSNSSVQNSALTSTGVTSFMERYSNSTREVAQDGRRGALMLTLSIKHPDVLEFIKIKSNLDKVTGANVSIKLTDEFLKSVIADKKFTHTFPINATGDDIKQTKEVNAIDLWNQIVFNAWNTAEPGILFWDKIISESPADCYKSDGFETVSTNPCVSGDTIITTNIGKLTVKEIFERFNNGEKFIIDSFNVKENKLEKDEIEDILLTKRNANTIELILEDNSTLVLTPDHKVFTKNRGWVNACQLCEEDILLKIDEKS